MNKNLDSTIYPCILFQNQAQEAAEFYTQIFSHGKILIDLAEFTLFEIEGLKFKAINSHQSDYKSNPAFSFMVSFQDVKELDNLWNQLKSGGITIMPLGEHAWSSRYGWIQDQFGVSWHLILSESPASMYQKISAVLVFGEEMLAKAEIASNFYLEIFKNSKRDIPQHFISTETQKLVKHSPIYIQNYLIRVMESSIEQPFEFSPGISLVVECSDQAEIDAYWNALAFGGKEGSAGWVKDKFGIYWQIIPKELNEWIQNSANKLRIISELKSMQKIDIAQLKSWV
jgi:predicted 3-demethylubiquinone-9 3-methyltransferase (glyoxalase superfamily)